MKSLLEAHGISKSFADAVAVEPVDLMLARGESVGIVGESGSGKTTLARMLVGLERPTTGSVLFRGAELPRGGRPWRESRRMLQLIPQHATGALNPRVTVRDHFREVIAAHGIAPAAEADDLARRRLAEVRLDDETLDAYPTRLSGGQQQRVVIARSLLLEPEVMICDEPTSALDVLIQEEIIDLLDQRCVLPDRLFAVITHDLRVAARLCDRIIVMREGSIVEDGTRSQIMRSPRDPYTKALLAAS